MTARSDTSRPLAKPFVCRVIPPGPDDGTLCSVRLLLGILPFHLLIGQGQRFVDIAAVLAANRMGADGGLLQFELEIFQGLAFFACFLTDNKRYFFHMVAAVQLVKNCDRGLVEESLDFKVAVRHLAFAATRPVSVSRGIMPRPTETMD